MNYTRPNDTEHQDSPKDWLAAALVFTRALGVMLEDGEGICVEPKGDALEYFESDKLIVANSGDRIEIIQASDIMEDTSELKEGQYFTLSDKEEEKEESDEKL